MIYSRMKARNDKMEKLALEYGLKFENKMPPYNRSHYRNFKQLVANWVSGNIGQHSIEISDVYHDELHQDLKDYLRFTRTIFKIDDKEKMEIKDQLTLRSSRLTTINELRSDLKKLF